MPDRPCVAIIGVGLIGGSIGLALRQRRLTSEIVGVGRRMATLDIARKLGAIDRATTNLVDGVANADWVIIATPVDSIVDTVKAVAAAAPRATITDAGSTKGQICREIRELAPSEPGRPAPGTHFIGSHPLAGGHRTGPEFARADLLVDRMVVVTPDDHTPPGLVERTKEFWEQLGAEVALLAPDEHDRAVAATSHLPHLIAAALASSTPEEWLQLTGSGWGDTTRIAAGSAQLWTQIFSQNRAAVLDALRRFEHRLAIFDEVLSGGDAAALTLELQEAKRIRDAVGD